MAIKVLRDKRKLGGGMQVLFGFGLGLWLAACGGPNTQRNPPPPGGSPGEKAFFVAEEAYQIPSRLMMAVAYLESRVSPFGSSAAYQGLQLGPKQGETAFGISMAELDLRAGEEGEDLLAQIDAYAKWLSQRITPGLPAKLSTDDEKFIWIWELAQLHRSKSNTRILFARELIDTLNRGFTWLDPRSQAILTFPPEEPAIHIENLAELAQKRLVLDSRRAEIDTARMFVLRGDYLERKPQKPRGIEIIHCPFSLSACLELQIYQEEEQGFWLGAHYVIPADDSLVDRPIQVTLHEDAVPQLSADGAKTYSDNRVVIMLTGHSGRLIGGQRQLVNPNWLSKWQLRRMGELVHDVCTDLVYAAKHSGEPELTLEECMQADTGTKFRINEGSHTYHWGDLFDFDRLIFQSYIDSPDGLAGQTVFDLPDTSEQIYRAGDEIKLTLNFDARVNHVVLERLVRCGNGQTIWIPLSNKEVRSQTGLTFSEHFWDSGPNANGSQFFRAKVYGPEWELRGWSLGSILLSEFNADSVVSPEYCSKT